MVHSRKANDGLLARVNFPLYSVEMLTSRHVLVAGGGGSAKTGVANGFEIYEIYHNGRRFVAEEIVRHETGANVVMNCAVKSNGHRSYLVAGQESHCQLYNVDMRIVQEDGTEEVQRPSRRSSKVPFTVADDQSNLRNRRVSSADARRQSTASQQSSRAENADINENPARIRFDIKSGDLIQTDFTAQCPLQRVVRISPDCRLMATGGTDAHIRVWSFPKMNKKFDIGVHTKEVDDLDFSPNSKQLVSIAKDGLAIVWDLENEREALRLAWTPPEGVKYLFKRCRFGLFEGKKGQHRLFTIANPLGKVGQQKGYLHQWSPENGSLTNAAPIDESLASLAVRDDGRFVAIGTMFTGSVSIYVAFSLQRVLHIPSAHSMFVTGLEFLPSNSLDGPAISSNTEAAVLSISVDNKVCIHNLTYRHTIPAWLAISFIIVMLFLTFMLCSYIGL